MAEKIYITSKDGTKICGDYYFSQNSKGIVLLHMMPATKESWGRFSDKLQKSGFQALAIDLRGHGESDGGPDGYRQFSDIQHQQCIHDTDSAVEFLKNKGVDEIYFCGASIGANLSLQFAAQHAEIKKIVLLSAGLNYYGIITEPLVLKLQKDQSVYFVGDEDDMRKSGYSAASMAITLFNATNTNKKIRILKGAGHGTDMLAVHPELEDELVQWLLQ